MMKLKENKLAWMFLLIIGILIVIFGAVTYFNAKNLGSIILIGGGSSFIIVAIEEIY